MKQINARPDDPALARCINNLLTGRLERFQEGKVDETDAQQIYQMLELAGSQVRERHLLPPLQVTLDESRSSHEYEVAEMLAPFLEKYDPSFNSDELQREIESWEFYLEALEAQGQSSLDEILEALELSLESWQNLEAIEELKVCLAKQAKAGIATIEALIESNPDETMHQFEQSRALLKRFSPWCPKIFVDRLLTELEPHRHRIQRYFVESAQRRTNPQRVFHALCSAGRLCREKNLSEEDARILKEIAKHYKQSSKSDQATVVLRYILENRTPKTEREDSDVRTELEGLYTNLEFWDECAKTFDERLSNLSKKKRILSFSATRFRIDLDSRMKSNRHNICEMHAELANSFESLREDMAFCRIVPCLFLETQIRYEEEKSRGK